jgi:hypothetical protein
MATSYHCLFDCNNTIEENDSTLPSSFSFQTQSRQNTQENNNKKKPRERRELTFKLSLYPLTFGSASTLLFQTLSSFQTKKKNKEKKNHREEKKCKEGRELSFKLLLYPFTFGCRFYPSISNAFSWHLLLLK